MEYLYKINLVKMWPVHNITLIKRCLGKSVWYKKIMIFQNRFFFLFRRNLLSISISIQLKKMKFFFHINRMVYFNQALRYIEREKSKDYVNISI